MALKVWKDGAMKKINTNLHKPVIFLNGTKYVLSKAYTFVGGDRQLIWGEEGVKIDYISSTGVLGGGRIIAIGEDWAILNQGTTVFRVDISNLSDPQLIQSVQWGAILRYNALLSTGNSSIFLTSDSKLNITQSGAVEVLNTYNVGGTYLMDALGDGLATILPKTQAQSSSGSSTGTIRQVLYGTDIYKNNTRIHSTGSWATGNANSLYVSAFTSIPMSSSFSFGGYGYYIQTDTNTILLGLRGNQSANVGTYKMTESSLTKFDSTLRSGWSFMDNGNIIQVVDRTTINIVDKDDLSVLHSYTVNNYIRFLGKIGSYYYVLNIPENTATYGVAKLLLLSDDDLSVVDTKDLPDDPFNENGGAPNFWVNCQSFPHISKSGFLGVATYNVNNLALRIARFSGIF